MDVQLKRTLLFSQKKNTNFLGGSFRWIKLLLATGFYKFDFIASYLRYSFCIHEFSKLYLSSLKDLAFGRVVKVTVFMLLEVENLRSWLHR